MIGVVRLGIMLVIVVVLVVVADGRVGGSLAGMVDGRGRRIEEQRSSERVEEEKTRRDDAKLFFYEPSSVGGWFGGRG